MLLAVHYLCQLGGGGYVSGAVSLCHHQSELVGDVAVPVSVRRAVLF